VKSSPLFRRYSFLVPTAATLTIYLLTVCRTLYIGDGAEFALVLKSLGITHPPGYPLFTVVGSIFVQALFFMRPILAANVFNVLVSTAAVAVLFLILRRYLTEVYAALVSLGWALIPAYWSQAIGVEIYNANMLLMLLTLLVLEGKTPYKWPMVFYLYGLCLDGNPTSLALAPTLLFMFFQEREYRRWRRIALYLGLTALAGTLYFYLWVRSAHQPAADWGHPVGIAAWLRHITLGQYRNIIGASSQDILESIRLFWYALFDSWWWVGVIGVASGIYAGFRRDALQTVSLLLLLVTTILFLLSRESMTRELFLILLKQVLEFMG